MRKTLPNDLPGPTLALEWPRWSRGERRRGQCPTARAARHPPGEASIRSVWRDPGADGARLVATDVQRRAHDHPCGRRIPSLARTAALSFALSTLLATAASAAGPGRNLPPPFADDTPIEPPSGEPFVVGFDIAEQWNELALAAIRTGPAKPTITAHQLFMVSAAMYDAFAAYSEQAVPYARHAPRRRAARQIDEANRREAVSVAAHTMLRALFPAFEAEHGHFSSYLASLGYPSAGPYGRSAAKVGVDAARAVIRERSDDGSGFLRGFGESRSVLYPDSYEPVNEPRPVGGEGPLDPNHWQPLRVPTGTVTVDGRPVVDENDPASYVDQSFLTPSWGAVTPFALTHGAQFRPPVPPAFDDHSPYEQADVTGTGYADYAGVGDDAALTRHDAYVEQFGQVVRFSADLTDEHKFIAEFWADGPRTESPPGHWNQLAHGLIERGFPSVEGSLGLEDSVKLFFVLNASLLDASIASWEAKRYYDFIRPTTAIRFLFAGEDILAWGGPDQGTKSIPGAAWEPYQNLNFVTPPFPEYVSGHSAFSRASAEVLTCFFGNGSFYDGTSETLQDIDGDGAPDLLGEFVAPAHSFVIESGPEREIRLRWHTLIEAADEAGISRLYGGIHLRDGDLRGRTLGERVGRQVFAHASAMFAGEAVEPGDALDDWACDDG